MSNKSFNKLLLNKNALLKQPENHYCANYQHLISYKISIFCNRIYRNSSCRNFHSYSDQWVVTYSKQIVHFLVHRYSRNSLLSIFPASTNADSFPAKSGESYAASRKSRTAPQPCISGSLATSHES